MAGGAFDGADDFTPRVLDTVGTFMDANQRGDGNCDITRFVTSHCAYRPLISRTCFISLLPLLVLLARTFCGNSAA